MLNIFCILVKKFDILIQDYSKVFLTEVKIKSLEYIIFVYISYERLKFEF